MKITLDIDSLDLHCLTYTINQELLRRKTSGPLANTSEEVSKIVMHLDKEYVVRLTKIWKQLENSPSNKSTHLGNRVGFLEEIYEAHNVKAGA